MFAWYQAGQDETQFDHGMTDKELAELLVMAHELERFVNWHDMDHSGFHIGYVGEFMLSFCEAGEPTHVARVGVPYLAALEIDQSPNGDSHTLLSESFDFADLSDAKARCLRLLLLSLGKALVRALAAKGSSVAQVQADVNARWGSSKYGSDYEARRDPQRDAHHAFVHMAKVLGKLGGALDDLDHAPDVHGQDAGSATTVRNAIADMVICSLRMASAWPGGSIDMGKAIADRIAEKSPAITASSAPQSGEAVADRIVDTATGMPFAQGRNAGVGTQFESQFAKMILRCGNGEVTPEEIAKKWLTVCSDASIPAPLLHEVMQHTFAMLQDHALGSWGMTTADLKLLIWRAFSLDNNPDRAAVPCRPTCDVSRRCQCHSTGCVLTDIERQLLAPSRLSQGLRSQAESFGFPEMIVSAIDDRPELADLLHKTQLRYGAAGVAQESGELLKVVRKHIDMQQPFDAEAWNEELGDVLFYLVFCARVGGTSLERVLEGQLRKLQQRFDGAWSPEKAIAQADKVGQSK
jgi:NTP pyrophosphatase (non-canonical NTP hydrolase)